jgi:hypothetical protein
MKSLFEMTISGLRDSLHHRQIQRRSWQSRQAELLSAVERIVDGTDSTIRFLYGYRKQLAGVVGGSLEFIDDLIGQIPAAITVSREAFVSDPYVNAFFANVSDLQSVFSHSSEIREFMEGSGGENAAQCCALLCMRRTEKTVTGMELSGGMLKRDVRQTAVNFTDHRIYSPGTSEQETRAGLKQCVFAGLVTNALQRIMESRMAGQQLQHERQILHTRLRHYRQKMKRAGLDARSVAEAAQQNREISRSLDRIEQALAATPLMSPQESLKQVVSVFGRPDEFIQLRRLSLRLNKMGIKIEEDSAQPCNEIELTEVIISNEPPRVVTLAIFRREEMLPGADFLSRRMPSTLLPA